MKTIRNKVFETNSSSMHTITFNTGTPGDHDNYVIDVNCDGEYGWGPVGEALVMPSQLLDYALIAYSAICKDKEECDRVLDEVKRVFATHGVTVNYKLDAECNQHAIWFEVDPWDDSKIPTAHVSGYIDHQSAPHESDDCMYLAKMVRDDPEELYGFVFGGGEVILDNDNHD